MSIFNQMLGNVTQVYLNVAFILCVFIVAAFKPQRIDDRSRFRLACLLFAISIVLPNLVSLFADPGGLLTDRKAAEKNWGVGLFSLVSPFLFALSFLAAIDSITPRDGQQVEE